MMEAILDERERVERECYQEYQLDPFVHAAVDIVARSVADHLNNGYYDPKRESSYGFTLRIATEQIVRTGFVNIAASAIKDREILKGAAGELAGASRTAELKHRVSRVLKPMGIIDA